MKTTLALLLLGLTSLTSSFALEAIKTAIKPIIVFDQQSGHTPREYAFSTHCELNIDGLLTGTKDSDITTGEFSIHQKISIQISKSTLAELLVLINEAQIGPMVTQPAPCDIGNSNLSAVQADGLFFPILVVKDCYDTINNMSPAATKIADWFFEQCVFE